MVDMKAQIAKGLAAHKQSIATKEEIRSFFRDTDQAMSDATGGKVGIKIDEETMSTLASLGRTSLTDLLTPKYAIYAYNRQYPMASRYKLASWEESSTGYPCSIRVNYQKIECYDLKSLATEIGNMLSTPEAGRAITDAAAFSVDSTESGNQ